VQAGKAGASGAARLDSLRKLLQVVPDEEADSDKELGALV
jgi:GTPase engC